MNVGSKDVSSTSYHGKLQVCALLYVVIPEFSADSYNISFTDIQQL